MRLKRSEILRLSAIYKWADARRLRAMERCDMSAALRACDLQMRIDGWINGVVFSKVSTYSDAA
jgi:hypothetical protein